MGSLKKKKRINKKKSAESFGRRGRREQGKSWGTGHFSFGKGLTRTSTVELGPKCANAGGYQGLSFNLIRVKGRKERGRGKKHHKKHSFLFSGAIVPRGGWVTEGGRMGWPPAGPDSTRKGNLPEFALR